ncbi:hypothetical protein YC2023_118781 [Brassica napus]
MVFGMNDSFQLVIIPTPYAFLQTKVSQRFLPRARSQDEQRMKKSKGVGTLHHRRYGAWLRKGFLQGLGTKVAGTSHLKHHIDNGHVLRFFIIPMTTMTTKMAWKQGPSTRGPSVSTLLVPKIYSPSNGS